jgi:uncharacterized protein (TIGR02246 family)
MSSRLCHFLAVALLAFLGAGLFAGNAGKLFEPRALAMGGYVQDEKAKATPERQPDQDAIAKLTQEFIKAFDRGDAKAIAAMYTERCEYIDDTSGEVFQGRAEVERAFTELFKLRPGARVLVQTRSTRFPGRDMALLEALVSLKTGGSELPLTTRVSSVCVREDGQWKVALERESGADEDKLEDLGWLIGSWAATTKEREVQTSYRWNDKKTMIVNQTTVKEGGRVTSSIAQRIGLDPETGQIRSWMRDGNGSRGQGFWHRDGNSWLIDTMGTLANGTETASVNIITRINDDAFTWRSVDRLIGGEELPGTDPVKVVRVKTSN